MGVMRQWCARGCWNFRGVKGDGGQCHLEELDTLRVRVRGFLVKEQSFGCATTTLQGSRDSGITAAPQ